MFHLKKIENQSQMSKHISSPYHSMNISTSANISFRSGGKVRDLDIINMVWGNPQWIDPDEDQNYNLNFTRQQHHDMGPQG